MTAEPDGTLASVERLTHAAARQRWGSPDEVEGSVNDPRTRETDGIRWNECWTYLLPDGRRRRVYWHRYNCRGVRIEEPAEPSAAARG
ncbi:MAG: hypothetical protein ACE5IL_07400 [Myxococcota bacterium]